MTTPPGDEAVWGTGVHRYLRDVAVWGHGIAIDKLPDDAPWREACKAIPVDLSWRLGQMGNKNHAEWTLAIHPLTGEARALGYDLSRVYRLPEPWVCGTLDLAVESVDGDVTVWDYKTGRDPPAARTSGQLALAALAVARLRGLDEVRVGIVHIREDGSFAVDEHTYDLDSLAEVARRLREAWGAIVEARALVAEARPPSVATGPWCRYCPAATHCPAQTSLARRVLTLAEPGSLGRAIAELSAGDAGRWWVGLETLERLVAEAKERLRDRVWRDGALALPDGSTVVPVEATYESIAASAAAPVLLEHGVRLSDVTEPRVTKEGLTRALRERGRSNAEIKAVFAALRAAGAIKRRDQVSFRVHKKEKAA